MRWIVSNLMTAIQNILMEPAVQDERHCDVILQNIRNAMLLSLGKEAGGVFAVVQLRVTRANSIQDLWYLRDDLMAAMSAVRGERAARQQINRISDMFKGFLPEGLCTRPSPLSNY